MMITLCIYPPNFYLYCNLFVSAYIKIFVNKVVPWYEGTLKYLGESVTGMKMGFGKETM